MERRWWETRSFAIALIFASMIPLLLPDTPPLTDVPGHMGRYRVQLDLDTSPYLRSFYGFEWKLIGNLGVDLLIIPMSKLFGLELGLKLIVLAIPALTVAGFLAVAREAHGTLPPTATLALPLAYSFPFHFGFINYCLSMALAFLAFAFWMRLGRYKQFTLRAFIFVPLSLVIWVTHVFGWGVLGVLAFASELSRERGQKRPWLHAGLRGAASCVPLMLPFFLMALWRSGDASGVTGDWFNWNAKVAYFMMAFRDQWQWFDLVSSGAILIALAASAIERKCYIPQTLLFSAAFLFILYIIMPRIVFGSAYADMRLAPFVLAILLLGMSFPKLKGEHYFKLFAALSVSFFALRIAGNTASLYIEDRKFQRELAAVAHIPPGARLISLVGERCNSQWAQNRLVHLPSMALVRKEAFANDQWVLAGAQLLTIKFDAGEFSADPSQIVTQTKCKNEIWRPINQSLRELPYENIDYLWMISPPKHDESSIRDFEIIWENGSSTLYQTKPALNTGETLRLR